MLCRAILIRTIYNFKYIYIYIINDHEVKITSCYI